MVIDPKIEDHTRTMLGQAVRGELSELDKTIDSVAEEVYGISIAYCVLAAAYIAIDLSSHWPTDADVREIARHTATSSTDYKLREQDVYDYISRMALADENINDVFPGKDIDIKLPILITAQMLLGFRAPRGMRIWEYLDSIWNAFEMAERADLAILPALMLRGQRVRAAATKS